MASVQKPTVKIEYTYLYNKIDITRNISPSLLSVTFTDNEHAKSDEIELQIEDSDHKWKDKWYPEKGAELNIKMGYDDLIKPLMNCGSFEIDEIENSFAPDTVSIRGLSTSIKKSLRQNNNFSYGGEDAPTSLVEIAYEIASKHKFSDIIGANKIANIKIKHISQYSQSDLAFLTKLAESYGYIFSVKGDKFIFYSYSELENEKAVLTLNRTNIISGSIKNKSHEIYKACEIAYWDKKKPGQIKAIYEDPSKEDGDILKLNIRCENVEQAKIKAKAALKKANRNEMTGNFSLIGDILLKAGKNIEFEELGVKPGSLYSSKSKLDGKYHIRTSRHSITRLSGYTTEIEVRKIV